MNVSIFVFAVVVMAFYALWGGYIVYHNKGAMRIFMAVMVLAFCSIGTTATYYLLASFEGSPPPVTHLATPAIRWWK